MGYELEGGLAVIDSRLKVEIVRSVPVTTHPFTDYFKGFERVEAVRRIFGERTEEVLRNLRVEFGGALPI